MTRLLYSKNRVYNINYNFNPDKSFENHEKVKISLINAKVGFPDKGPWDEAIINIDVGVETKVNEEMFRTLSFSVRFFFKIKGDIENVTEKFVMDQGYGTIMSNIQALIKSISEIGGNIPIIINDINPNIENITDVE
ncbi:hypothetical protein [Fructobacillus ficulneus]|uniref:Uncharacterized protein n=1 Tax=Fructobacillus ficulneus TaxID=157463 RepID=A0A0K8MHZ6_9LACO|nr:hypothetical protein [Fructobacillus ficulneus]GAO99813.1 hypothetical protein FFIC_240880 [Fructobacillus ficulneus]